MIRRWRRKVKIRMSLQSRRVGGPLSQRCSRCIIKALRPIKSSIRCRPVDGAQIVHDVAAADDQYAALSQRCKTGSKLKVKVKILERIDGQLYHGNIRLGES